MHCCCKRKNFLFGLNKMIGPVMLLALRETTAAMEVRTRLMCLVQSHYVKGAFRGVRECQDKYPASIKWAKHQHKTCIFMLTVYVILISHLIFLKLFWIHYII